MVGRGDHVLLTGFTDGCIIPDGEHIVSSVNADGSFQVGGRTAVWPHRIKEIRPGNNHDRD